MDKDGYPEEHELDAVRKFFIENTDESLHKFMELIKPLWRNYGYVYRKGNMYVLATGGWSGNESVIAAMKDNFIFWMLFWHSSRRSGRYVFKRLTIGNKILESEE
jgi:hypothetical protein